MRTVSGVRGEVGSGLSRTQAAAAGEIAAVTKPGITVEPGEAKRWSWMHPLEALQHSNGRAAGLRSEAFALEYGIHLAHDNRSSATQ